MPFRNPLRTISADKIINWGLATIIGAFYKTSETGNRWEIGTEIAPPFNPAYIRGYTGESDELKPSEFTVNRLYMELKAGSLGNALPVYPAYIRIGTSHDGLDGDITMDADRTFIFADSYMILDCKHLMQLGVGPAGALRRSIELVPGQPIKATPRIIQSGVSAQASLAAGAARNNIDTTFPEPFATVPRVVMTPHSGRLNAGVGAVTTTGFNWGLNNWTSGNASAGDVQWIATTEF